MKGLNDLIAHLKQTLNLTDVMEEMGVTFTSKGKETWKAKCFMHDETSPSLTVSVNKQVFNCFSTGCMAKGDVLNFWRLWHNLDAFEAAVDLAKSHGVDHTKFIQQAAPDPQAHLVDFMRTYTARLHERLLKTPKAMEYLKKRGVSEETAKAFQIGYSPGLGGHGSVSAQEYRDLNLYRKDLYEDTLIFPVIEPATGKVYHYAKKLGETAGSKYIGVDSHHPGRFRGGVFGLSVARRAISGTSSRGLIFVEGFFDVLTLFDHGIKNVVGVLGASPSAEQFEAVKKYGAKAVKILLDGDRAGLAGTEKIIKTDTHGVRVELAFMPEGDPDEYVLAHGVEALTSVLDEGISPIEHMMCQLTESLQSGGFYTKADSVKSVMELVARLPPSEQVVAINKLQDVSGLPGAHLWDLLVVTDDDNKQTIESERQMLAGAIHRREDYVLISSRIPADAQVWSMQQHAALWGEISKLYEKDVQKISEDVLSTGFDSSFPDFISQILVRNGNNLEFHITNVLDAASRRGLASAAKRLEAAVSNKMKTTADIVSEHLARVSADISPTTRSEFTSPEQVDMAMEYIHERMGHNGEMPGVNLGKKWKSLMQATLGFQDSYMYLVAASAKAGKTALAQNWALTAAVKSKIPTLWLNLEMSERDLALRNLSIVSGISNVRLRMGALNQMDKKIVDDAAAMYYESPLYAVNAAGLGVHEVVNIMRKYVHTKGVKLIFLDYIQLINTKLQKGMEYWEGHMNVSTALKNAVSRDLKVPLIAVSQLNRFASQEGTSGGANIAGSYKYIQDCDCYLGIRPRSAKELEDGQSGNMLLHIEYNRHGPQDVALRINFNRDNLRIEEAE